MRILLFAAVLGLALPLSHQARAFDFQKLSDAVFGPSEVYGSEDPKARAIEWTDLTPPLSAEAQAAAARLNAMIDTMTDAEVEKAIELIGENGGKLIEALDGETVSIEGYLVPLDFEATEAKAFVLVPYMGACVHVPPPPPNQVVFIEFEEGIPMEALERNIWTPFRVTGPLRAAPTKTELADVGYQMAASGIRVSKM